MAESNAGKGAKRTARKAADKGNMDRPAPRAAVERMAPYKPPAEGRTGKLRLDFNENTIGCSEAVTQFLSEHLVEEELAVYPEYSAARKELAAYFQVDEAEMLLTNGTDEAIQVLVNTYVDDEDDVIILHPAYAMYRFYTEVAGGAIREIPYRPGSLAFPLQELLGAIQPSTKAILISNPNNPTGTGIDLEGIQRILKKAPNAAVLIDEAYYEFSGVTALKMIRDFPNLFVSRTFSKVFGMAAMRMGCLFTQAANAEWLRKAQSPYSVNTLAVLAARAAIRNTGYIQQYVGEALAAKELLYVGLEKLKIPYIKSQGNFVLMQLGDRAIPIRDALREKGILVRDRSYEIAGCVRVTTGTREQMRRFLQELALLWGKK